MRNCLFKTSRPPGRSLIATTTMDERHWRERSMIAFFGAQAAIRTFDPYRQIDQHYVFVVNTCARQSPMAVTSIMCSRRSLSRAVKGIWPSVSNVITSRISALCTAMSGEFRSSASEIISVAKGAQSPNKSTSNLFLPPPTLDNRASGGTQYWTVISSAASRQSTTMAMRKGMLKSEPERRMLAVGGDLQRIMAPTISTSGTGGSHRRQMSTARHASLP